MSENRNLDENWLPVGEEPLPSGSITECTILRRDGVSVVALQDGDIDVSRHPSTGLYHNDTRYISLLSFSLGGIEPVLLDSAHTGHIHSTIFTNRAMVSPLGGDEVPARALVIRRRRLVFDGLKESISISNYAGRAVRFELRLRLGADFHDIFEVRGYERSSDRQSVEVHADASGIEYRYTGTDNVQRACFVRFSVAPERVGGAGATFVVQLAPRATSTIETTFGINAPPTIAPFSEALASADQGNAEHLASITRIRTDDERLNDALERSLLDLHSLRTETGDGAYTAAGVPWFDALFGRDSLIAGMLMLPIDAGMLRETLVMLAKYQAKSIDAESDASPGKMPHELRWGELARSGEVPFGCYYGSVDSTPLFLVATRQFLEWTGDEETIRSLWGAIRRAHDWCLDNSDEGWLSYARMSAVGLENQGWKDSHDAIAWPDGRLASPPIALVEVQGYLIAALEAYAELAAVLREPVDLRGAARVNELRARLETDFGLPGEGYSLCLDGTGMPVPTAASNQGHLLWSGVASDERARAVARRLFASDMFSGWGIRTMSAEAESFNPLGYHTGSIWPHDNAIILGGLRRYGFDDEATRLVTALTDAALSFDQYQVPELFSGDDRGMRLVPTPYPVASRPQAWAAASLPYMLVTLLGVQPAGPSQLAIVRPRLPRGTSSIELSNLRYQGGSVDLSFRRQGDGLSVEVMRIRGDLQVVLSKV